LEKQIVLRFWQIVRFGITGAVAIGLYYGILYALTEFLSVWYLLSAIVTYLFNVTSNFLLHKFWTFKNKDTQKVRQQMLLYLVMCIVFFAVNTASLYVLVDIIHLWYIYAQVILTVILSAISYFLTKQIFATGAP
jgi:putative flippase GtrA